MVTTRKTGRKRQGDSAKSGAPKKKNKEVVKLLPATNDGPVAKKKETRARKAAAGKRRGVAKDDKARQKKGRRTLTVRPDETDDDDEEEASATGYHSDSANESAEDEPTRDEPKEKRSKGPTLVEAFRSKAKGEKNHLIHELVEEIIEEEKNDETTAQEELRNTLLSNNLVVGLAMTPGSAYPVVVHSLFQFQSKSRNADENHQDFIVFLGDRSSQGDPMAYVIDEENDLRVEVDLMVNEKEVDNFVRDPSNDGKLFVQSGSSMSGELKTKRAFIFIPVNDNVGEWVAENNPSLHDLDDWLNAEDNDLVTDEETANLNDWVQAAAQTANKTSRKKSSVLSHPFTSIPNPSAELQAALKSRLEVTLGRAREPTPRRKEPPRKDDALRRRLAAQESKIVELENAKKLSSNQKWSDQTWAKLMGYSGVQSKEQCSPVLRELEECNNVEDAISILKNSFKKTAVEENLRVTSLTVTEDLAKMLMKGQFIPPGADTPLEANIPKTWSHVGCGTWTASQKNEYAQQTRAAEQSVSTRTYEEALKLEEKESTGKLARSPPETFQETRQVNEDFLIRTISLLTNKSKLVEDMWETHDFLNRFAAEGYKVSSGSWRALSFLQFNNETQFFAQKATMDDIVDGVNLPESMFIQSGTLWFLQLHKRVEEPADILPTWHQRKKPKTDRGNDDRRTDRNAFRYDSDLNPKIKDVMKDAIAANTRLRFSTIWQSSATRSGRPTVRPCAAMRATIAETSTWLELGLGLGLGFGLGLGLGFGFGLGFG